MYIFIGWASLYGGQHWGMEHKRNAEKELSLNAAIPLSILDRELRPPRPADGMRKRVTKRPTSGSAGTRANSADPGSSPLGGGGAVTSDDGGSRAATRGYTPRDMRGPKDAATVEEYNAVLSFPPVDRAEILQTAGGSLSVMARTVPFQALGTSVLAATRFARRPHLNPALQAPEVSGGDTRGGGVAGKGGGGEAPTFYASERRRHARPRRARPASYLAPCVDRRIRACRLRSDIGSLFLPRASRPFWGRLYWGRL